jgi:ubiquinone/menaquinone biosynthesis C-methylase UbiE
MHSAEGWPVVEALGGFDPRVTYDDASWDYEDSSRDFWQYLSVRTVDRLGLRAGERVLDVPCGTGHSLIAAAQRVGPSGRVVGLDYADQMLAIAREKVRASDLGNVEVHLGDMTAITAPAVPYDAVICVLGIFFVDDMPRLVRSFYDFVRPGGGRVGVTVFGERFSDPLREVFVQVVRQVAPRLEVVEPWRRTEDASVLRSIFDDAGLGEVTIETQDDTLALPSVDDWWRIVMGSALRRTITSLGHDLAGEVRARCAAYIDKEGIDRVVTRSRYAVLVRD